MALGCVLVACGARTGLIAPEIEDASIDAGLDAPHDTAPDVPADSPKDVVPDVPPPPPPPPPGPPGCADGQREGFVDGKAFPDIAGCSGGWTIPGVMAFNPGTAPACPTIPTYDTVDPACNRQGGNNGPNPNGVGCNVADLCQAGWHVCTGAADVASHSLSGCNGATEGGDPPMFFVTRQSSNGCGDCATGTRTDPDCNSAACTLGCLQTARTSNDVFACGNLGATSPIVQCGPIDRFSNNLCGDVGSNWTCNDDGTGLCEAYTILHDGPAFGGAVCCRN